MRIRPPAAENGPCHTSTVIDRVGARVADALQAACRPALATAAAQAHAHAVTGESLPLGRRTVRIAPAIGVTSSLDVDALVVRLFEEEGQSLVRLVRLFVDDRNAAEDLVQEAFIRLARSAHRIKDPSKAPAYLRSVVLNLARDHNRRGLVSLRHHLPGDLERASTEDHIVLRDDQLRVIDALRQLPHRQRDCVVLRYYEELGIDDIAA